jgi:hypothetical protein
MDSVGLQRDLYDTLPDKLKKSSVQTATLEWKVFSCIIHSNRNFDWLLFYVLMFSQHFKIARTIVSAQRR